MKQIKWNSIVTTAALSCSSLSCIAPFFYSNNNNKGTSAIVAAFTVNHYNPNSHQKQFVKSYFIDRSNVLSCPNKQKCLVHPSLLKPYPSSGRLIQRSLTKITSSKTNDDVDQINTGDDFDDESEIELEDFENNLEDSVVDVSTFPSISVDKSKNKDVYGKRGKKNRDFGKNEYFSIIDHFSVPEDGLAHNSIFQSLISDTLKKKIDKAETESSPDLVSKNTDRTQSNDDPTTNIIKSRSNLLNLKSDNVTLPIALLSLRPEEYPSLSRARKACRYVYAT